jgi:hypothetical protein
MYITRDDSKSPVQDFLDNVTLKLNSKLLAEAEEKNGIVVGWNIIQIKIK